MPLAWEYPNLASAAAINATAFSTAPLPSGDIIQLANNMPQIVAADASQNSVVLYPGFIFLLVV